MNRTICLVLLFLQLFAGNSARAKLRGRERYDSLEKALVLQKEDTGKVDILCTLCFESRNIDPKRGVEYGKQALSLSEKLHWDKQYARIYKSIASNYKNLSEFDLALTNYFKALKILERQESPHNVAKVSNGIGSVYGRLSNYPKALEYFFKALRIDEENGDEQGAAIALSNIATVYTDMGEYEKSLEYSFKALETNEKLGKRGLIANTMGNIAGAYYFQNKFDEALEYFFKALNLFREIGDKNGVAATIGNIGDVYFLQHNYTLALTFGLEALDSNQIIGDRYGIAGNLMLIGSCYFAMDTATSTYDGAAKYTETQASHYRPAQGIPSGKDAKLVAAMRYINKGIAVATEIGATDQVSQGYQLLTAVYRHKRDTKHALDYYKRYVTLRDSLSSEDIEKKVLQQQVKYKYDRREDSLELVNTRRENADTIRYMRQRSYTWMGVGGVALLALFTLFAVRNNRLLAREKIRSEKLLRNILPADVAAELKETGQAQTRRFDNVTILFTDFVGFTGIAANTSPAELVRELHTCFKKFDEILARHQVEKIKTIGDAYLAVCGLPNPHPQHALRVVQAALEINAFMLERRATLGAQTFEMRIGVHTGSVVAGIVGARKFGYDIWGEAVETAALMEHCSEAGQVNISETTYELVKNTINCSYWQEALTKDNKIVKSYKVERDQSFAT